MRIDIPAYWPFPRELPPGLTRGADAPPMKVQVAPIPKRMPKRPEVAAVAAVGAVAPEVANRADGAYSPEPAAGPMPQFVLGRRCRGGRGGTFGSNAARAAYFDKQRRMSRDVCSAAKRLVAEQVADTVARRASLAQAAAAVAVQAAATAERLADSITGRDGACERDDWVEDRVHRRWERCG